MLLCLVPLLVWAVTAFSKEDSGVVTVLLAMEDERDVLACEIVEEMMEEDSIIRYVETDMSAIYEKIENGEADCAWIFRENFEEKLISTFSVGSDREEPVYVVAQEDNVVLQLARTKLYGYIFPHLAFLLCENYLEGEIMGEEAVSREELEKAYERAMVEDSIIKSIYLSPDDIVSQTDTVQEEKKAQVSYLMTPVRGILLVLLVMAGLVVAMFYQQDEEEGRLAWIPLHKRRGLFYSYQLAALFDMGLVVLLSLSISEGKCLSAREHAIFLLYLTLTGVFCEFMQGICKKKDNLAKAIPLLVIAMLGVCPVFLDWGRGFLLQYIFPPSYYLRAGNDKMQILFMLVYMVVLFAGGCVLRKINAPKR